MPFGIRITIAISRTAYTATSSPVSPSTKDRDDGGSRSSSAMSSASGPTTSAPITGPHTVPMPPITAGTIASTDTAAPNACSGPTKK